MKYQNKILFLLFLCFTFVLTGCAERGTDKKDIQNCLGNITDMTIDVEYQGSKYKGELNFTPEKVGSIKITSPEGAKGTVFSWEDDKIKISKDGLSCESEKILLSADSFISYIIRIFNSVNDNVDFEKIDADENKYILRGKLDEHIFEIILEDNEHIKEINIPDKELKVTFDVA